MKTKGSNLAFEGAYPLTKREYFAAQALQGLLASYQRDVGHSDYSMSSISGIATDYADRLIIKLNEFEDESE